MKVYASKSYLQKAGEGNFKRIVEAIKSRGLSDKQICKKFDITILALRDFQKAISFKPVYHLEKEFIPLVPVYFGSKKEPYYSEEDMLKSLEQRIMDDVNK